MLFDLSYINTDVLIKRKAELYTWKDQVKERDIKFLLDLNTEHLSSDFVFA
jgi:hypothetical protein